jgi:predicted ATPase
LKIQSDSVITLDTNKEYTYRNSIFFDGEKDNPIQAIPKMLNPNDGKTYNPLIAKLILSQEESHGESLIPTLYYILNNAKDTLICLDETSLSLTTQLSLVKWLENAVKNGNQIIISTHSLYLMMQYNNVYSMENRKWIGSKEYIKEKTGITYNI